MRITQSTIKNVYKASKCSIETAELRGYELVKNLFVDSSGLGADDEPALTGSQFEREVTELLNEHGTLYAFITDAGQFQVYVGLFKKTSGGVLKKIVGNAYTSSVYERTEGNRLIVRLYDTDIITIEDTCIEKKYTVNSGGWRTRTTSKWINKYLPSALNVYQKDFEWFIFNSSTGKTIEFSDGLTVTV
jgi:hypothetical protein